MTNNRGDKIIKAQVHNLQVSFDKEAAWMRLQDRLESKDGRKGYSGAGWAAAAMLIVATVLWYASGDSKKETIAQERNKITVPAVKETPVRQEVQEQAIAVTTLPPVAAHKSEKARAEIVKQKEVLPATQETATPVVVKEESVAVEEDTPPANVIAKPKMRTVHINEVIEEEFYERRMLNRRYAGEPNFLLPKRAMEKQEYNYTPSINRKSIITDPYEEYRIIQN